MEGSAHPRSELSSGAFLLAGAAGYLWVDRRYPLGSLAGPGPGVFPLAVGLLLAGVAVLLLARGAARVRRARGPGRLGGAPGPAGSPEARLPPRPGRKPWLMAAVLVLYLLVVARIGFAVSSFALTVASSKLMGARGWVRPAALGAGVVLACHLLFSAWLKVPLPSGWLW